MFGCFCYIALKSCFMVFYTFFLSREEKELAHGVPCLLPTFLRSAKYKCLNIGFILACEELKGRTRKKTMLHSTAFYATPML